MIYVLTGKKLTILPVGSATGFAGLLVGAGTGESHKQEKRTFFLFLIEKLVETKHIYLVKSLNFFLETQRKISQLKQKY
jgi:hypothetical protein